MSKGTDDLSDILEEVADLTDEQLEELARQELTKPKASKVYLGPDKKDREAYKRQQQRSILKKAADLGLVYDPSLGRVVLKKEGGTK